MKPQDVGAALEAGAVVLDMRPPKPFSAEHIKGAVNIQFNRADLADRAEMSLPTDRTYIVHAEPEPIAKVAVRILEDAGFSIAGYLEGGLKAWREADLPIERLPLLDVDQLEKGLDKYRVLDTREGFEFRYGHVPGAELLEWTDDWANIEAVTDDTPLALVCGDQVRSCYVASVLQRAGKDAHLVFGGMVDWLERGYPVESSKKN